MALSQGEHYELMNDLEDKLGKKTAVRLAEALPPFDWNELARQAEVDSKIDALDARLSGRIDRLAGRVEAFEEKVGAQTEVMKTGFAAIEVRLAAMDHRLDTMDQRLEAMDRRFDEFSHQTLHRVYRTMVTCGGVLLGVVAAIVT